MPEISPVKRITAKEARISDPVKRAEMQAFIKRCQDTADSNTRADGLIRLNFDFEHEARAVELAELEHARESLAELNKCLGNPANRVTVQQQGDRFRLKVPGAGKPPNSGGLRSEITEFSKASRKRLIEKIQSMDRHKIGKPVFITLTYGQKWPTVAESKANLRALMKRIQRKFPRASGFWRLEFQERGAPHFHLIVFGLDKKRGKWPLSMDTLNHWWGEIIDYQHWDHSGFQPREPLTGIESLASWKKLVYYVSKYVAKIQESFSDSETAEPGEAGAAVAPLFIYGAYLDGLNPEPQKVGRYWGTFGTKNLPYAELEQVILGFGKWYDEIWTMARFGNRFLTRPECGFTIFSTNTRYWYNRSIAAHEREVFKG